MLRGMLTIGILIVWGRHGYDVGPLVSEEHLSDVRSRGRGASGRVDHDVDVVRAI